MAGLYLVLPSVPWCCAWASRARCTLANVARTTAIARSGGEGQRRLRPSRHQVAGRGLGRGEIDQCHRRHLHKEFMGFLGDLGETLACTSGTSVHIAMDDLATLLQLEVRTWFVRQPEYVLDFTPTGRCG